MDLRTEPIERTQAVARVDSKGAKRDSSPRRRWIDVLRERMGEGNPDLDEEEREEEGEATERAGPEESLRTEGDAPLPGTDEDLSARIERIRSLAANPRLLLACHAIRKVESGTFLNSSG
jgi:hypothetical protein